MVIFCWGSTNYGQLGLGGIEEDQVLAPKEMNWPDESDEIKSIACGQTHTLFVSQTGKVSSCGNNDHGQLGYGLSRKRPHQIVSLDNYIITQSACGATHSMAINNWGQLFTWGSNRYGQLARETQCNTVNETPKIVKALAAHQIVQIATGDYHSLALTSSGSLYTWGGNEYGQLGIGSMCEKVTTPQFIKSLTGIPIAFIACGANHSFVVSKSGAVFGWGKNQFGQLGLNHTECRAYPQQLKTLRTLGVRYIQCGEEFSVFLTSDGGVLTCGSGTYGQLGQGITSNEHLPRMVAELMGTTCTQISCGRRHTLTFVPSRGRVYGFGIGSSGQLGHRMTGNCKLPQVVMGPWVSPSGSSLIDEQSKTADEQETKYFVRQIFSGGDHSFTICSKNKSIEPVDCRFYEKSTQMFKLSIKLAKHCTTIGPNDALEGDLMTAMETIFKSLSCLNASFLMQDRNNLSCGKNFSGIDIEMAMEAFDQLKRVKHEILNQLIWDGILGILGQIHAIAPADVETLRIYLILPLYHEFDNPINYMPLQTRFVRAFLKLSELPQSCVSEWYASQSRQYFQRLVDIFKKIAIHIVRANPFINYGVNGDVQNLNLEIILGMMHRLFQINHTKRRQKISHEYFHLPEVTELLNIPNDYLNWLCNRATPKFFLCSYPFIFDAKAKTILLQTDQSIQMQRAMQNAATSGMLRFLSGHQTDQRQYLMLNVSRDNIVQDTIREITQQEAGALKKPLKVKFHGEEAEDAGGVRKEFFLLLLKKILDGKYGMFKEYETRRLWFVNYAFEEPVMYKLIGILCGLAIYNFTIINLPFPLALYKKLLKEKCDLNDLYDLSPVLARSFEQILDYTEPDFENVFCLSFQISIEYLDQMREIDLIPNGKEIPVTLDNKQEYVDLYVDYIFNKSVAKQFNEFNDGFMKVCGGRVMELFKPHELMAVVVGNEDYDWKELEAETTYKNGYTSSDQTIKWFWEVFHDLPVGEKKNFLLFLTGSDRIPIQGMKAIKIIIQPIEDNRFLPVAHTCFNLLDLPRYNTKEKLKYKLCQAIQQTHTFSIV